MHTRAHTISVNYQDINHEKKEKRNSLVFLHCNLITAMQKRKARMSIVEWKRESISYVTHTTHPNTFIHQYLVSLLMFTHSKSCCIICQGFANKRKATENIIIPCTP